MVGLLRLIAWALIAWLFITVFEMSSSMNLIEAFFTGALAGAISGILMRLVNTFEEADNKDEDQD